HLPHKLGEARLVVPAELPMRLGGIAKQNVDLGRAEITCINRDHDPPARVVYPDLVDTITAPSNWDFDVGEGALNEFAYRVRLAGSENIVTRRILRHHPPHPLDVVAGMAPVALGIQVAQIKAVLHAKANRRHRARDLSCNEGFTPDRAFMIE